MDASRYDTVVNEGADDRQVDRCCGRVGMSRRDWLRVVAWSAAGAGLSPLAPTLARAAPVLASGLGRSDARRRHCVLLWMPGGASQTDTFDMKPGHANGGPFAERPTVVPGVRFSEHLPRLAAQADELAIVRGMSTAEGDHNRGTYYGHIGRRPGGPIQYPTIGAALSRALETGDEELPAFVSVSPFTTLNPAAFSPGFLGPRHAALTVGSVGPQVAARAPAGGFAELGVDDLASGVGGPQLADRLSLWEKLQGSFLSSHPTAIPQAQHTAHERALRLMRSEAAQAFDLTREPARVRESYGGGRFGQGCLMARRLIERGVSVVEIALSGDGPLGWDTHTQNFPRVQALSQELDLGWSALLRELKERGLLESTTFLWMGEFGRTPAINNNQGRDHYPRAWTAVLAGAGVRGGQAYGRTSADGAHVEEHPVDFPALLATLCAALDVDPAASNLSEVGRPIPLADSKPIPALLS